MERHDFANQINALRAELEQLEQIRDNKRQRELLWESLQWERRLKECMVHETARDLFCQKRIDESRHGSDTMRTWEQRWYELLDEDKRWYLQQVTRLQQHLAWHEGEVATDPYFLQEVRLHHYQIVSRYYDRCIRQAQLRLEILERHRYRIGRLEAGRWTHYWEELTTLLEQEENFFHEVLSHPPPDPLRQIPPSLYAAYEHFTRTVVDTAPRAISRRREWCEDFYQQMMESWQWWNDRGDFDRESFVRAARRVKQMIKSLQPPRNDAPSQGVPTETAQGPLSAQKAGITMEQLVLMTLGIFAAIVTVLLLLGAAVGFPVEKRQPL